MKKLLFVGALLSLIKVSSAQSDFKLQTYLNVAPFNPNSYSNAIKFGIETVRPKWNYGLEYSEYYFENYSREKYYVMDSNVYRNKEYINWTAQGISFGLSRALQSKTYKTRFIYGMQIFGGVNTFWRVTLKERLDSNYLSPSKNSTTDEIRELKWRRNSNDFYDERYSYRNLSVGIALMAKLELTISKRFTFSPAVYLPYMIHNENSGRLSTIDPGMSFLLGYQFLK